MCLHQMSGENDPINLEIHRVQDFAFHFKELFPIIDAFTGIKIFFEPRSF